MVEHTPGPWSFYESPDVSRYGITNDGGLLDIADLPYDVPLVYPPPDVQLSNARLISAAPDMEKALEKIVLEFEGYASDGLDLAIAAIAKAKGETDA